MSSHNFTIADVLATLHAIAIFPVFLVFPGYAIAWILDLFDFRRRTLAFRFTLAVPLSIAICPILTFTMARFATFAVVWAFYGGTALLVCVALRFTNLRRPWLPAGSHKIIGILAVWLVICVLSLIDIQIGDRLYFPTSVFDYSVRSAFVHSISSTGVPPQNPFFSPGHPVLLRYHYFWLLMCSLVNQVGGSTIASRHAIIAGTFWIGIGMVGLLAIYLRLVQPGVSILCHRLQIGIALLAITGLDILPSLFFWFLYAKGWVPFVQPGVELWNEHVEWFLSTVVSTPHAIAALIACFMAYLLLCRTSMRNVAVAALALASAAGCSIWVVFVFALFLAVWTLFALYRKHYREASALCFSGALSLILALPYLREIAGAAADGPAGAPLKLTVRAFSFTALVPTGNLPSVWRLILVNGSLLPVNYLLEFGLFFLIARIKWQQYRTEGRPLSRHDLAMTFMAVISTLVCTFLSSGIAGNNDLGWRGFLIAQFVLLLWAVDLFGERHWLSFITPAQKQLLAVFFALGFAGTVTDLAIIRFYPVLADRGVVPPLNWMSPDRDFGRRAYAARSAYEWLHRTTPFTAVVQADPNVAFQDTFGMFYADRRSVAADVSCLTGFGGNSRECVPIVSTLQEIFPRSGNTSSAVVRDVCGRLGIDVVVAKDTDNIWSHQSSWVWREHPIYANSHWRLFGCQMLRASGPAPPR